MLHVYDKYICLLQVILKGHLSYMQVECNQAKEYHLGSNCSPYIYIYVPELWRQMKISAQNMREFPQKVDATMYAKLHKKRPKT